MDSFLRSTAPRVPLPVSEDFAAYLGLKESDLPQVRRMLVGITEQERYEMVAYNLLSRIREETFAQQDSEVIFSCFTAIYLVKLLEKWIACPNPISAYFAMLNNVTDNPYFQTFLASGHPLSKDITRIHAERLCNADWSNRQHESDVFDSCQFLSTMLLYEDSDETLPPALRERLVAKLNQWKRVYGSGPDMDPLPRALGLVKRVPSWVHDGRKVRKSLEDKFLACNRPRCPVPYVPGDDKLRQCSRCKTARYCSPEHQREHWPEHKMYCHAPAWL